MKKKIVYAGLAFLLIAVVLIFASGNLVKSSLSGLASFGNLTVASKGFYYSTLNVTNTTRFFMVMKSNSSLNVYLMSANAFGSWYGYMHNTTNNSLNGLSKAVSLEGSGVSEVFRNTSFVELPSVVNSSAPFYTSNATFAPGIYTVIIDNSNGSASYLHKVYAELLLPTASYFSANSLSAYKGSLVGVELLGLAVIILFILALLFIGYGLLSKRKPPVSGIGTAQAQDGDASKDEVDALYRGIGKGKK